ncbi:hypothetical protein NQZ68_021732 [Dissostichus eleginoides]|nr:hypothetical protein NQZ68_021732 [Dissostichus eleginoides]
MASIGSRLRTKEVVGRYRRSQFDSPPKKRPEKTLPKHPSQPGQLERFVNRLTPPYAGAYARLHTLTPEKKQGGRLRQLRGPRHLAAEERHR